MPTNGLRERELLTFVWSEYDSVTVALVCAVATVSDADVDELDPVSEAVDPDALNAVFAPTSGPGTRTDGSVHFQYQGYPVRIDASGVGHIYAAESEAHR